MSSCSTRRVSRPRSSRRLTVPSPGSTTRASSAKALKVKTFRDASCGSATTVHFTKPQTGLPIGGTNPPQFNRLTKTPTSSPSASVATTPASPRPRPAASTCCLTSALGLPSPLGGSCKEMLTAGGKDQLSIRIKAAEPKVVAALKAIRKKSPKARILLVNYLAAVPKKGCYPYVQANDVDIAYLYVKFNELNAMVQARCGQGRCRARRHLQADHRSRCLPAALGPVRRGRHPAVAQCAGGEHPAAPQLSRSSRSGQGRAGPDQEVAHRAPSHGRDTVEA